MIKPQISPARILHRFLNHTQRDPIPSIRATRVGTETYFCPGLRNRVSAASGRADLPRVASFAEVPHRVQEAPGVVRGTRRRLACS